MADWRQIQARIRKAKTSSDPPAQLAELYQRTRDAMVAFELAQWHEKAGDGAAAAQWYTSAAQRFRRAQWRTKAEEALTRLGAPVPAALPEGSAQSAEAEDGGSEDAGAEAKVVSAGSKTEDDSAETTDGVDEEQPDSPSALDSSEGEQQASGEPNAHAEHASAAPQGPLGPGKKRRRGRRGGRGRRSKGGRVGTDSAGATAISASSSQTPSRAAAAAPPAPEPVHEHHESEHVSQSPVERVHQPAAVSSPSRTRTGDPALASRISQLESQLRRLLACPQSSLDEADQAPAGPGVLILSDSDQVTHYYIEACQTLRIAVGNLVRGGRGDGIRLKERMAENLGIAESRVAKYLKDHCAVRWLQLDEGARELAHFAISVLRPAVNE
jgi:hypothetical protein